jgi:hypothetical protein
MPIRVKSGMSLIRVDWEESWHLFGES